MTTTTITKADKPLINNNVVKRFLRTFEHLAETLDQISDTLRKPDYLSLRAVWERDGKWIISHMPTVIRRAGIRSVSHVSPERPYYVSLTYTDYVGYDGAPEECISTGTFRMSRSEYFDLTGLELPEARKLDS